MCPHQALALEQCKRDIESLPRIVECFRFSSSIIISVGMNKNMKTLINSIINEIWVAKCQTTHKDKTRTAINGLFSKELQGYHVIAWHTLVAMMRLCVTVILPLFRHNASSKCVMPVTKMLGYLSNLESFAKNKVDCAHAQSQTKFESSSSHFLLSGPVFPYALFLNCHICK